MSSSQSLRLLPAESRPPKGPRLEKASKDAAYSAAMKLLDLLDILLRVHLGESNWTYPIAFKSDILNKAMLRARRRDWQASTGSCAGSVRHSLWYTIIEHVRLFQPRLPPSFRS